MKKKEFQTWRRNNLLISLVGVVATMVGTGMNFFGHSHALWIVVGGVIWYVFFYLRYIVIRRWHKGDQLNELLDQYHELRGNHRAILLAKRDDGAQVSQQTQTRYEHQLDVLRAQIELAARRHLLRDVNIATILTRRFVILTLHRFATRYRHELVNPILDMIRDGVIREGAVIVHLDEPAAFADVVLPRMDELKTTCPRLIELCRDHWPAPEGGDPGTSAPALPPDGLAPFQ